MFRASEISHEHPTLRRLVPYVELGVNDHLLSAYRGGLGALAFHRSDPSFAGRYRDGSEQGQRQGQGEGCSERDRDNEKQEGRLRCKKEELEEADGQEDDQGDEEDEEEKDDGEEEDEEEEDDEEESLVRVTHNEKEKQKREKENREEDIKDYNGNDGQEGEQKIEQEVNEEDDNRADTNCHGVSTKIFLWTKKPEKWEVR